MVSGPSWNPRAMPFSGRRPSPCCAPCQARLGCHHDPRCRRGGRARSPQAGLLALAISMTAMMATVDAAEVYRTVGPDGTVSYSDQPPPAGTPVEMIETTELETVPPASVDPGATTYADEWTFESGNPEPSAPAYQSLAWVSPQHDAAVRANGGILQVTVAPTPPLQQGHQIEVLMDGATAGRAAGTSITTTAIDRGTHQLVARVLDAAGATLVTSPPITVYVLRHSVAAPPRPPKGSR